MRRCVFVCRPFCGHRYGDNGGRALAKGQAAVYSASRLGMIRGAVGA